MNLSSVWKRWQRKLTASSRTTKRARQVGASAEVMEQRQMLSASALFLPATGELSIELDSTDSVRITSIGGTLSVSASTNGGAYLPVNSIGVVPAANVVTIDVLGGDDANTIDFSGITAAAFTSLTSLVADGANGNDLIIGSPDLADSLIGGNGADTINAQGGNDTIAGGDGADSILAGTGDDSISSGDGDDSVSGEDGNDTISAGNGQDTVSGGNGNDSVSGFNGQDSLLGDAGDDTLNGDGGTDTIDGGAGNDSILGGEFNDSLLGGDGNDTILGQAGNDNVDGGIGNDSLDGGAGNDSILGNDGNDFINGGLGSDTAIGNNGSDTIFGGSGSDSLLGDGPDAVSLETGNDSINGQAGNDTIIGGRGGDTLNGAAGTDLVQSFFIVDESVVAPPPAPPPPPPPPTVSGGAFPDAVDSGLGVVTGSQNTQLAVGSGDASLQVQTDSTGTFSSSVYDPIGAVQAADTTFRDTIYFRRGVNGGTGARSSLTSAASNTSNLRVNGTQEANSTFDIGSLNFALTQTVAPTLDSNGVVTGAILTQTYRITNTGAASDEFELLRYYDGDLQFDGTLIDGGGRFVTSAGDEVLFETDRGGGGTTATTFVGMTGKGGTIPTTGRFSIDDCCGFTVLGGGGVAGGVSLNDAISGDTNGDQFIENGNEYDVTLGLRNLYNIAAGASAIYTTHTIFGSGVPTAIAPPVQNQAPVATANSGSSSTGGPVTIDVVSNDSDADGALDYSTVTIATPPANGTAISLGNGLITYTPNAGFNGTDTFTYTIADNLGAVSNPATVTITIISADNIGDLLLGSDDNDTLIGSVGNDTINGQGGNDSILGGAGNDLILGGSGNDTLDGQTGDDTLDGQGGNDVLIGGDGNDSFVMGNGAGGDDFVTGGTGFNQIIVNGTNLADTLIVGQNSGRVSVTRGLATITADTNMSVQGVTVNALAGDDTVTIQDLSSIACPILVIVNGGDGNDVISGQGSSTGVVRLGLNGDAGNDTIVGSEGNDSINGGTGNDSVNGRAGNDAITGSLGDDILAGGLGNDTVDGGNGNDFLTGQEGDDSMSGGDGNDTLRGFAGNDTLQGQVGDDLLNGMDGDDSILGGVGQDSISGGSGDDILDGGRNDDTINGNAGNDNIRGDHGNDYIATGTESDTVNGGDGNDTIIATDGNDLLAGNDGDDRINAGGGNDTVVGGDGNDTLLGGGGNDVILGGDGDDVIDGQGGTDTIAGNQGIDIIADPGAEIDEHFQLPASILAQLDG